MNKYKPESKISFKSKIPLMPLYDICIQVDSDKSKEITDMYRSGKSIAFLSRQYGFSRQAIIGIVERQMYLGRVMPYQPPEGVHDDSGIANKPSRASRHHDPFRSSLLDALKAAYAAAKP